MTDVDATHDFHLELRISECRIGPEHPHGLDDLLAILPGSGGRARLWLDAETMFTHAQVAEARADRTLERVVAVLVRNASPVARREILRTLDEEAAMTNDRGWPDESQDPPDRTAPIGDRQWVPENVLAVDGQQVTMRWTDEETGVEREEEITVAVVPEMWKEAARRRGQDVDATTA